MKKEEETRKAKGVMSYGKYVRVDDEESDYWKTEEVDIVKYGKGMQFESIHHPPKIKDLKRKSS